MLVRKNVDLEGATLITDEFSGYIGIGKMLPQTGTPLKGILQGHSNIDNT